ncbi:MAG: AAA family ATPase [Gemmataceae bacterium]|nr:AAA family ATPase [Gemmataceae bacterium]
METLIAGLADGEGVVALFGPPGTGKTLLSLLLAERLAEGSEVSLLPSAPSGRAGLLQAALHDLGQPYEGRTEAEARLALVDHLLAKYREGRRTVLLLDEAHSLAPEALEEVRMLGNLEGRGGKALQAVLIGLPDMQAMLLRPSLACLRQRLAVRAQLDPLPLDEAVDYVLHHVRAAGGDPAALFSQEALEMLARASGGVPRLLGQGATAALRIAAGAEAEQADAEAMTEALSRLGMSAADEGDVKILPGVEEDPACRLYAPRRQA